MLGAVLCNLIVVCCAVAETTRHNTVEPRYNEDLKNYLVITGFSLYQGKNTKKYKELGPAKLPCYKRVLLYPTSFFLFIYFHSQGGWPFQLKLIFKGVHI